MSANDKQMGGNHYKSAFQHWDLSLMLDLDGIVHTATKYVSREKEGVLDLEKALHCVEKLLETRGRGGTTYTIRVGSMEMTIDNTPPEISDEVRSNILLVILPEYYKANNLSKSRRSAVEAMIKWHMTHIAAYLVIAKAHIKELIAECKAAEPSNQYVEQ